MAKSYSLKGEVLSSYIFFDFPALSINFNHTPKKNHDTTFLLIQLINFSPNLLELYFSPKSSLSISEGHMVDHFLSFK